MLQSGFLDVTPASYLTSETMTDVHLTFGTTTDTDNSDFGTVGGVAASLIFHGKYGDLAGSFRGDTLHQRFFQTDYAYTR
jgi:hypothetical protein